MRKILISLCLLLLDLPAKADSDGVLSYAFEFELSRLELDDLSLGSEAEEDRLIEEEAELSFSIEYQATDQLYYFFGGSLIDETEEVKPDGEREQVSGFERGEMGVGYTFGETIESELIVGRREFVSASSWWYWWDEELDSISLAALM